MNMKRKVLYEGSSDYGRYRVVEMTYNGRPARVLWGDRHSPQSGAALDEFPELLFDYNQRFLEMILSKRPKRILVIGGGAFMLPIAAFHQFRSLQIDVVEIDGLLVDLAREHFALPDDKRLRVHVDDGAKYVAGTHEKYDMIIIDAFSGYSIPHHLVERDTIVQYAKHLRRGGVVAMNFISEYKSKRPRLAHEIIASFGEVFPELALYQADVDYPQGEEQNFLLVAGKRPAHFDYLHSTEHELYIY